MGERKVDHTALRFNQASIITLSVLGWVLNQPALVAFVALVMLVGTAVPAAALFQQIYFRVLRPRGWLRPRVLTDNPEPHRFAQGLGGTVLALGVILLFLGYAAIGWALTWAVIVLAALNLFFGFCAGCFVYYQLNRLGVPGFTARPIERREVEG
ncbi:DUF4395 domain-containing protein [Thermoflexus sp.]|uniref:DUF4395 domain-containing protein n=1 Tax=Thermoflexus sp. TaxID=1969742 RepID=UPI0025DEAABA|nr:DUF4395 domain-containing protein [Thermoflexus sp.]MDW8064165.1 DUF4395 domain-containing protein [Anaerolineae bacterium]MCS6963244.1 DUF4395 domain-containing protein [Thermoflexus sp.]MCS7351460.1 DUF4395 domain-containing protein [Thermoflexus sp.]MCX7691229.1 DUF4395 domain-containing protein [Thermoflexus sp.]MDW8180917.1 DUF4395 domain-containing protein [Anaerolineae bacterium]